MVRAKHPRNQVEHAIQYAERFGWRIEVNRAHWGIMYCPQDDRTGCKYSVSGTPRNADDEAKRIYKAVDTCREKMGHRRKGIDDEDV